MVTVLDVAVGAPPALAVTEEEKSLGLCHGCAIGANALRQRRIQSHGRSARDAGVQSIAHTNQSMEVGQLSSCLCKLG